MSFFHLLSQLPPPGPDEALETLMETASWRLERIISHGHATAPGEWFDQARHEWVMVLEGRAGLRFEDDPRIHELERGEAVFIPAHRRHRVEWTAADRMTIWLALHFSENPR